MWIQPLLGVAITLVLLGSLLEPGHARPRAHVVIAMHQTCLAKETADTIIKGAFTSPDTAGGSRDTAWSTETGSAY